MREGVASPCVKCGYVCMCVHIYVCILTERWLLRQAAVIGGGAREGGGVVSLGWSRELSHCLAKGKCPRYNQTSQSHITHHDHTQ